MSDAIFIKVVIGVFVTIFALIGYGQYMFTKARKRLIALFDMQGHKIRENEIAQVGGTLWATCSECERWGFINVTTLHFTGSASRDICGHTPIAASDDRLVMRRQLKLK